MQRSFIEVHFVLNIITLKKLILNRNMKLSHYLARNKIALSVYKVYRMISLWRENKKIHIDSSLDTSTDCYIKGCFYIFSVDVTQSVNVSFNNNSIDIRIIETHNFSHKYPGFFEYEIQLPVIGFPDYKTINQFIVEVASATLNERKVFNLDLSVLSANKLLEIKIAKLNRIKGILISPMTRMDLVDRVEYFESVDGMETYNKEPLLYNFLPLKLREIFNIIPTHNISAHDNSIYEETMIEELHSKGIEDPLILDCGAGLKPTYRKEVVNFEIVNYPTTDVMGVNEKLPFKDNSFDAVFSAAVLEHVKDPFASAKEISRVLKPGGILMAFVPFLQPYHGYPYHYYNMTVSGIRNLFDEEIDIKEVGTNLHPLDLMPWYIGRYTASLNRKDAKAFINLKLKDFYDLKSLSSQGFYTNISQQTHQELAFVVKAIGYKKL